VTARFPTLQTVFLLAGQWRIALLAALFYAIAGAAGWLFSAAGIISWAWPAGGVAFAAIWHYRRPALPGIWAGAFLIESLHSGSWIFGLLTATGALVPGLVTLALMRGVRAGDLFDRPAHVFRFIAYAGGIGPLLSSLIGALALHWVDNGDWSRFLAQWRNWWFGDAIGVLLFAPPLLTLGLWRELDWSWFRRLELLALFAGVLLYCGMLSFIHVVFAGIPLSLLIMPFVIWGALRFNFAVGSAVVLIVALWSMVGAALTQGSHIEPDPLVNLIYVQIFLIATACISLAVGATIAAQNAAIIAQRTTLAQLRDSEDRFRVTFEQAGVGVALIGLDFRWQMVNQRLCSILGYSRDELLQLDARELLQSEERQLRISERDRVASAGLEQYSMDKRVLVKSGETIWCSIYATVVRDAHGEPKYYASVIEDISDRKRAEAAVERMALYDALTGLPNRRLLLDRLRLALPNAQRTGQHGALLFIDLDRFKVLNDAHGHSVGDLLLVQAAERMQRALRAEDTVARLAGDEFIVLLQNLDGDAAAATTTAGAIAENLRALLQVRFMLGDIAHNVSASIGVTLFPGEGKGFQTEGFPRQSFSGAHEGECRPADAAESLLKEADIAMYRAKQQGANAVCFYAPEMQTAAELRLGLERSLRQAIVGNQLRLFVQPQVNVSREIVGAEVLLRWLHPERGMIAPATFIPIAEESGLIVEIGSWVLRGAAQLARQINQERPGVSISVNVSPRQFRERDFVEHVQEVVAEAGADPRWLVLEITEGIIISDFADTVRKMSLLQEMGFRLSIDDFGTGYSSLSYLKKLPVHELKIDRSFVDGLPHDADDVALVETILSTARHFGLDVVAEGVETEAQFEFLGQRECRLYQGYHFGYPDDPARYFPFLGTGPFLDRNARVG
jgi:diguanylate cyclase (GGDEF)-like protein/PAS domain S-box-containing protein